MNIHPLFVHFPIGLLVTYVAFEIIRVPWLTRQPWYFHLKAVLSIVGAGAAYVAAFTGGLAEELVSSNSGMRPVIEKHEMMASTTILIFTILAAAYFFAWLQHEDITGRLVGRLEWTRVYVGWLGVFAHYILRPYMVIPLALIGLVTITFTGALGASMVYGPDVDPFVTIIYHLFF